MKRRGSEQAAKRKKPAPARDLSIRDGVHARFFGLDSPQVRITLWTREDSPLDELLIGNPVPEENAFYAKLAGGKRLYLVGADFLDKLPKDTADFKGR